MSVLEIVLAVIVTAVLFAAYAIVRPAEHCSGNCGACGGGACSSEGKKP